MHVDATHPECDANLAARLRGVGSVFRQTGGAGNAWPGWLLPEFPSLGWQSRPGRRPAPICHALNRHPSTPRLGNPSVPSVCSCSRPPCFPGARRQTRCKMVQNGAIGSSRRLAEPMILSPHHSVCGRDTKTCCPLNPPPWEPPPFPPFAPVQDPPVFPARALEVVTKRAKR
jgi:hypothetical protein